MATVPSDSSDPNNHVASLECPVCLNQYENPRVLPCLHTVCETCLGIQINTQGKGKSPFLCPVCELPTMPSDTNLAVDKWASAFPLNSLMVSVMESDTVSENNNDCEPCKEEGKTTTAEYWCVDCQEKLCDPCQQYHKRMKMSRNHNVVKLDEKHESEFSQAKYEFDDDCVHHPGKPLEILCIDHRSLCCVVCFASNHRECHNIRGIDDVAPEQIKKIAYPDIISDVILIEQEMDKILDYKSNNITGISRECQQMLKCMDDRVDSAIGKLNALRKKFQGETEQLQRDTEKSLLKTKRSAQGFRTNVSNSRTLLEAVQNQSSDRHKFVTLENIRSQIMSHYQQLKSDLNEDVELHLTMKLSKVLKNFEVQVDSLGTPGISSKLPTTIKDNLQTMEKIMKNITSQMKLSTAMCAAQVEKRDWMTSSIRFIKEVKRSDIGNRTWFTSVALLNDGRILMSDFNNQRLVEFDGDYRVVKEHKFDGKPKDVAAGNANNELYVTANENFVYVCTLNTVLTITRKIKTPSFVWGVALREENVVVGTVDAMVILDQDGSTVKSIPKAGYYLATTSTPRAIGHRHNNNIVCRTWEGEERFTYQHEQLRYPCGICFDSHNNMYVCGRDSLNVHQVSADGLRSRILLEKLHNKFRPCAIKYFSGKNELIVTSWDENTLFEVYRLS